VSGCRPRFVWLLVGLFVKATWLGLLVRRPGIGRAWGRWGAVIFGGLRGLGARFVRTL